MATEADLAKLEEFAALQREAGVKLTPTTSFWDKVKFGGTALGRGAGNALLGGAEGFLASGALDPKTMEPVSHPLIQKLRAGFDKLLPPNVTEANSPSDWGNAGMEGAGGMILAPKQALQSAGNAVVTLGSGAAANMAAKLAGNATETQNPKVRELAQFLAGAVAGPGTALLGSHLPGMRQGPNQLAQTGAQNAVHEASQGADFAAARVNAARFRDVGSTTATAAEAFPDRPGLLTLAQESARSPGGEQMLNRTAPAVREADLTALGNTFLDRVNPPVSTAQVANKVADAANAATKNLNNLASEGVANRLKGKRVAAADVMTVFSDLLARGRVAKRQDLEDAYAAVADRLLAKNKKLFLTDLQEVSLNLKALKENPPTEYASTGRKISAQDVRDAIKRAEEKLGEVAPDFQEAMKDYSAFKQGPVKDMREGRIGAVMDTNPNIPKPTPQGRVDMLTQGLPPQRLPQGGESVEGILRQLSTPGFTGNKPIAPGEVARATFQRDLVAGPTNPGPAVRGQPGSQQAAIVEQLIRSSGKDPQQVQAPLIAADMLQNFGKPGRVPELPQGAVAMLLRPFRTGGLLANNPVARKYHKDIAEILALPEDKAITRIQELSMFDPSLRRQIQIAAMLQPQVQGD